jgi:hypothetical protein
MPGKRWPTKVIEGSRAACAPCPHAVRAARVWKLLRGPLKVRLPKPIYLNDGRTIGTLSAARDLMLTLPLGSQANEHWQSAAHLLLEAAYRGRLDPVRDAGMQVSRALQGDGLI